MSEVLPTPSKISASEERGAIILWYTAGVAIEVGQTIYLDASNVAQLAKADSAAHARAIGIAVLADNAYGESTIAANGQVGVCIYGPVWGFTGLGSGQPLWVSKLTAGSLVDAAPTTAYQYIVGRAADDDTFFVDPGTTTPLSA